MMDLKKEQYWYLVRELLAESREIARSNGKITVAAKLQQH